MKKLIIWAREVYWLPPILLVLLCISQKVGYSWFYYDFSTIFLFISTLSIVSLLVFLIGVKIFKNNVKSAIFSSIFIWWTFGFNLFSYIFGIIFSVVYTDLATTEVIIGFTLISYVILSAFLFVFLKKTLQKLEKLLLMLIFMFTAMIFFEVGNIYFKTNILKQNYNQKHIDELIKSKSQIKLPNIYYIVFDGYTSFKRLRDIWKFNNESIKKFLTSKGFIVADNSITPYVETKKCIGAYLNMNDLKNPYSVFNLNDYSLLNNIKGNRTTNLLSGYGYEIVNLSIFDLLNSSRFYSYFQEQDIFGNSIFPIISKIFRRFSGIHNYSTYNNLVISRILLNENEIYRGQGNFIYAHLMLPHAVYDFNRYGLRKYSKDTLTNENDLYLEQILFANRLIRLFVNKILVMDQNNPIIVIQGDHGFRPQYGSDSKLPNLEAHSNLNAICLSNNDTSYINTPVKI